MNIVLVSLVFCSCLYPKGVYAAEAPVETTTEPVIPSESPIETTTNPVVPTEPPIETTIEPVLPTEPPIEKTVEPVVPEEPPIEKTIEPVVPTDPPIEKTIEPVTPDDSAKKPGQSDNTADPDISGNETGDKGKDKASENKAKPSGDGISENGDEELHKEDKGKKQLPEVIDLTMPVFQTDSYVFDFIMDPYGFISETGAVRYGEKSFEEGGTLFFKNMPQEEGGDESYSSTSDFLRIVNKSTVSVDLTISLNVVKGEEISISEDPTFSVDDMASLYMALTDREGNAVSANSDGTALLKVRLEAAPEDAYIYQYNEDKDEYEITGSSDADYDDFEFAVKGACNPAGNWDGIMNYPELSVTWEATPLTEETESESGNKAGSDPVSGNTGVSDNSTSENGLSDNWAPGETEDKDSGSGREESGTPEGGASDNAVPDGSGTDDGLNGQDGFDVVSETTEDTKKAEDVKTMMMDVNPLDAIVREVYEVERSLHRVVPEE